MQSATSSIYRFKKSKAARCIQRFGRTRVLGQQDAVLGGVRSSALRASQERDSEHGVQEHANAEAGGNESGRSQHGALLPPTMQLPPRYKRPSGANTAASQGTSGRSKSSNSGAQRGVNQAIDPLQDMWRGGDDFGDPQLGTDGGVGCWPVDMMSLSDQQSRIMTQAAQAERSVHLAQLSSIHSGVMSSKWADTAAGGGQGRLGAASVAPLGRAWGGADDADAAQDADSVMRVARVMQLREQSLQVYLTGLGGSVHRPEVDVRRRKLVARMQRHMGALTRPVELPSILERGVSSSGEANGVEGGGSQEQKLDPLAPPSDWSAGKAFQETPLPPHEEVAAAGKAAHLRAMRALQADAPWWLVYTPSSLVDLREVKAAVPWRRWAREQGYTIPASQELNEEEQAKLHYKRQNREEAAFGTPLGDDVYPPPMASDIWMTAACRAFGGIGSASIAADYTKDNRGTEDDAFSPPAPLSSFDAFSIAQGMRANGMVDPWAVPPGAMKQRAATARQSSMVDIRAAAKSAGQAVDEWQAAELSSDEGGSLRSEGGGSSIPPAGLVEGDNVTEDFDFALSLLESAPMDIPSVPGVFGHNSEAGNLPSLAAPGDSISDRVATAQAALQRHTRAAASVRAHSEQDRAVAARRIQQAWRRRQVRLAARAQMQALQEERLIAANAQREAKWNEVYGRMAGLLRELVSDATGYTPPNNTPGAQGGLRGSQSSGPNSNIPKYALYSPASHAPSTRPSGRVASGVEAKDDDVESQPPPSPPRDRPDVHAQNSVTSKANFGSMGGPIEFEPPLSSTYPSGVAQGFRPLSHLQPPSHEHSSAAGSGSVSRVSTGAESSGSWDGPLAASFKGPSFAGVRASGILKRSQEASTDVSADTSARQSVSFARGVERGSQASGPRGGRPRVALPSGGSGGGSGVSALDDSFGALSSVGASTLSGDGEGGVDLSLSDTGSSAVAAAIKASMPHATPSHRGAGTPQRFFQPGRAQRAAQPSASAHSDAVAAQRVAADMSTPQAQIRRSR